MTQTPMAQKRIMVDMSATLIHHGHVRLLEKAAQQGFVIIGLTTDDEIERHKGYTPELDFEARKEILLSIRHVDEVIGTPWLISEALLDHHRIDILVHGHDNQNDIHQDRLLILPRTQGVSSTELRERSVRSLDQINARMKD